MKIEILAIGSLKESYLKEAIDEYRKRLSRYATVVITELAEEKLSLKASAKDIAKAMEAEGERILAKIDPKAHVVCLAIEGRQQSSEGLARWLANVQVSGTSHVIFVIGGSNGLSTAVKTRAEKLLSFSKMTLPHQLMRVVLLEQIYRCFKINHNEPYHK